MYIFFTLFGLIQSLLNLFGLNESVTDDQIIQGKLDNGFTYYIRENNYPEEKASLRLVVKVGSLHEQEGEEGVAHFIEHLVFRGTEHFKDGEVNRYLESIGCNFGADTNAFTGDESTIYQLDIPLENENALETALLMLSDFASTATLSDEIIEKERTVVLDELHRAVSSISHRILSQIFHTFLPYSPYAHHRVIGLEKVVQTVSSKVLRDFYKRWYRPDRMALIAVGDFDREELKRKIENCFSKIICPKEDLKEPLRETQFIKGPQAINYFDPELKATSISLFSFYPDEPLDDSQQMNAEDIKYHMISSACIAMLNDRLQKLVNRGPHFLEAGAFKDNFCGNINRFVCFAALIETNYQEGMQALHHEIQKVLKQGFTQAEWQKLQNEWKVAWQNKLNNIDKVRHQSYVASCIDHFLTGESLISRPWSLRTKLATTITVEEINAYLRSSHLADSFKIFFATPSKKVHESVSEIDLLKLFAEEIFFTDSKQEAFDVSFNVDPKLPKGKVIQIQEDQKNKVSYWTLENGIHLVLKNTDLEHDRVHVLAHAKGGFSVFSKEDFPSAYLSVDYGVKSDLINGLTHEQLKDVLNSKGISSSYNLELEERWMSLNAPQNHLETAFQSLHAFFTAHSHDQKIWQHLIAKYQEILRQQGNDPHHLFKQLATKINRQNHFYFQSVDIEGADEKKAREIFELCFKNPQDFTFIIVGDFNRDQIGNLVEKYLGSLTQKQSNFFPTAALPELFPQKIIHEDFRKGHHTYAKTLITIPVDIANFYKQFGHLYHLDALNMLLEQRLTEKLRHQLGNTYHVGVQDYSPFNDFSNSLLYIDFTSPIEQREEMVQLILKEIEALKTIPPSQEEISVVQSQILESKKKSILSNGYWIERIVLSIIRQASLDDLLNYERPISELSPTSIHQAAQILFSKPYYSALSHLPEDEIVPKALIPSSDINTD